MLTYVVRAACMLIVVEVGAMEAAGGGRVRHRERLTRVLEMVV